MASPSSLRPTAAPSTVAPAYAAFLLASSLVAFSVGDDLGPSVFLTFGSMAQGLALMLLRCGSAANCLASYSAQSLALVAISTALRLSSTLWLNGYLPADSSGDGLYQAVDIFCLVAALTMLRRVLRARARASAAGKGRREELELELVGEGPVVLVCGIAAAVALAAILRGDMNARPLFDTLWLAGHFLSSGASFPQLWLSLSRAQAAAARSGSGSDAPASEAEAAAGGEEGEKWASHFLSAMALSQLFTVIYMWQARDDVSCQPWVEGFNHTLWAILAPSALHLLLVSDAMPQLPSL